MTSHKKLFLVKQTIVHDNYDIFVVSESWLDPPTTNNDIQIPGHIIFRQDRDPHKSGGEIVVYIRKNLKHRSSITRQQLWMLIPNNSGLKSSAGNKKSFLLCAAYRPDLVSMSRFLDDFITSFMDSLLLGMEGMVTGDLNADILPGSSCPEGRALMDLCNSLNLSQLVTQPTRTTDTSVTLIDVALTTNKSFITICEVVADYCLVAVTLNLKALKPRPFLYFHQKLQKLQPWVIPRWFDVCPFSHC